MKVGGELVALLAVAVAVAAGLVLWPGEASRKVIGIEGAREFALWKMKFEKIYASPAEQEYRLNVFYSNFKIVRAHNSNPLKSFTMGFNKFTDQTSEEFQTIFTTRDFISSEKDQTPILNLNSLGDIVVPDSVDWSKTPVVSKVYDIGDCSAGYAFSAIQVVEAAKYHDNVEKGDFQTLSAQNIVDCSSEVPYTNSGCDGGCVFMSLRYVKEQGIASNSSYPYIAGDSGSSSQCQSHINRPYTIGNFYSIPAGRSDILKNLVAAKPVVVTVDPKALSQHYSDGIYDGSDCRITAQTYYLMLVGYGVDHSILEKDKSRYWILKNHIGVRWADKGYMKIARSEGPVPGICGITDNGVYVTN